MKRRVALVTDIPYEKVYYACLLLGLRNTRGMSVGWVNIDQLHQFLKKNQKLAEDSGGRAGKEWALWPPEMYPLRWDEDFYVNLLVDLHKKGLLKNDRRPDGNFFKCVHPDEHGLYQLRDNSKYDKAVAKARNGTGAES